ncbi:PepSY domain-containing protein [Massilia aerilata]|uniref:PepSY domain-containing protein n=1 Tax=Massilia aerilata TaxID=453817 RepID=A0ABW0RYI4_9BURK
MKAFHQALASSVVLASAFMMTDVSAAEESQAALQAQAKISQAQAQATALAKVPHGEVKSSELEKEHGRLIWSFDIAQPTVKGVTEIQVDARTGKIVAMEKENAAKEAKELAAEKNEGAAEKSASK